jgi:site-specific DNA recombinase
MRQAFELIESGSYNLAGCLRDMTQRGLRSMSGKVLTAGELSRMLRNPAYIGKIPTARHGVLPGRHVPCVNEATFQKVQMILDGKKPPTSSYQRNRPELPLRQFLLCAKCGYALTGGGIKNRYGHIYFYYWCIKSECRYVHARAERVHQDFQNVLKSFRINAHLGETFVASLREKWKAKNGNSQNVIAKLRGELQTAEDRKQRLLMRYLDGDSAIQENFETMQGRLDKEIEILKRQIEESEVARATFDDLKEFTQKMPSDLDRIWTQAPIDLQQKVQNLLFRGGLKYDPEMGFLNRDNTHIFNQLQHFLAGNLEMVGPEGFEPPTKGL